jgi:hypothetical protein
MALRTKKVTTSMKNNLYLNVKTKMTQIIRTREVKYIYKEATKK